MLRWTVALLLSAEALVAFVVPWAVPDRIYLRAYLGRAARESTLEIADDRASYLTWDAVTGWRNRPNASRNKWQVDEHGARATHPFTIRKDGRRRVLFLGDSVTNGGTAVTRDETISAFLEDARTEALNFGTMLFSLDQMLLDYERRLGEYGADVLVVGLSENARAGLTNRYVPFRRRSEKNMPYFKPRFALESGRLVPIPVPPREAYGRLLETADLLPELRATDGYYGEYETYKRCAWLPVAGAFSKIRDAARGLLAALREEPPSPLLTGVLDETVRAASERGAVVVFMLLPDLATTQPGRLRGLLPDRHARLLRDLRARGLTVVDVRAAFRQAGRPMAEVFEADGTHFTAAGNRIVAEALRPAIETAAASRAPARAGNHE